MCVEALSAVLADDANQSGSLGAQLYQPYELLHEVRDESGQEASKRTNYQSIIVIIVAMYKTFVYCIHHPKTSATAPTLLPTPYQP